MPRGKKRDNGRSVALGVAMGPFSPTRQNVMGDSGSVRPLSRVRWAVPPSKKHREVLPLQKDDYRKAQELRALKQPMLSHKTKTERERWLMDVGALRKPKDVELRMELYLKDKLSEIASPVVKLNDLRGLDQPKEMNMSESVRKMRAEKAKAEEQRLRKSIEDYQRGEAERQEAARKELEDLKRRREEEQEEMQKKREADEEEERVRERRIMKKKYPEPATVVSPASSKESSPHVKGKSVEDILEIEKKKSSDVQQLELDLDAACKGSSVNQVRMLLAMCPDGVMTTDVNGNTPLSIAASAGQKNIVELLLKEGSDVNHVNLSGGTPIARACAASHRDVAVMLLEYGADELIKDKNKRSALDYASERLKAVIQKKKVNLVETAVVADALFAAVDEGDVHRLVSVLLTKEHGKDVDANIVDKKSSLGWSLLHLACSRSGPAHLEIARLLIEQGVNVELPDSDGDTPLHLACQGAGEVSETLVGLLLECGAHEARVNKKGRTPIFSVCIGEGSVAVAQQLLVHESYLRHTDSQGRTCLFYACYRGHAELAVFLVGKGARIDVEDSGGNSPLDLCPTEAMATQLRQQRREREREDATAGLIYACLALDEAKVLASIKERVANLFVRRAGSGETVLHCVLRGEDASLSFSALRQRQSAMLSVLIAALGDRAADLYYVPDNHGWSVFQLACAAPVAVPGESAAEQQASERASDSVVDALYPSPLSAASAYLHEPVRDSGNMPLHLALHAGRVGLAGRLLKDGADARAKNAAGHTALHLVFREGLTDLVAPLLRDHGCIDDLIAVDEEGRTPADQAKGGVLSALADFQRAMAEREAEEEEARLVAELEEAKVRAEDALRAERETNAEEEEEKEKEKEKEENEARGEEEQREREREQEQRDRRAAEEFAALASEGSEDGGARDRDQDLSRVSSLSNSLGSDAGESAGKGGERDGDEPELAGSVSLATDGAVNDAGLGDNPRGDLGDNPREDQGEGAEAAEAEPEQ